MSPTLTVSKLTRNFGGLAAVSNVSLELAEGELVVVSTGRVCATAEGVFIAPKGGLPGSVD